MVGAVNQQSVGDGFRGGFREVREETVKLVSPDPTVEEGEREGKAKADYACRIYEYVKNVKSFNVQCKNNSK